MADAEKPAGDGEDAVAVEEPPVEEAEDVEEAEEVDETYEVEEAEEPEEPAPAPDWYWGTGRRKTAVARVRVRPGDGQVRVNKRSVDEYFNTDRHRRRALAPLQTAKLEGRVDVFANISGGGPTGQADAMLMGLARALVKLEPDTEAVLRQAHYLTRDARMVERKKYGRRGARRRFQYSKR